MSAWTCVTLTARPSQRLFRLVFESHDARGLGADSVEKHEPVSDIDTVLVGSLKALDPKRPSREADVNYGIAGCREVARTPAPQQTTRTGLRLAGFKRERQRGAAPASPQSAD